MSTDLGPAVADRQRGKAFRRQNAQAGPADRTAPPRQRRPALAALAVVLIVGGGLIAGLLALRLDERVPVVAARVDIEVGSRITADDLRTVQVASEGLAVIPEESVDQILSGDVYARVPISADTLLDQKMLVTGTPIGDGRAVVAVPLTDGLAPAGILTDGDLVQVVRVGGGEANSSAEVITEALVTNVNASSSDELGAAGSASVNLLVPTEVASAVIDAAANDQAGLALIARGQSTDVELEVPGS